MRTRLGKRLGATLGKERTDQLRRVERRTRQQLADKIAPRSARSAVGVAPPDIAVPTPTTSKFTSARTPERGKPNDRQGGWISPDPFVPHPQPTMTGLDFLQGLHEVLLPRTYLEIGVNEGSSLGLARTKSIGVDADFRVRQPMRCDLQLVRASSADFFALPAALEHFEGVRVDLAFINGTHLSDLALRDFMNVEHHVASSGVTVLQNVLPRNRLEAARTRRTSAWTGDIYKVIKILVQHRPDLAVVLVNTSPAGMAIIVGSDTSSSILQEIYPVVQGHFQASDPQSPPLEYMARSASVDPAVLLVSDAWPLLVGARASGDLSSIQKAKDLLRSIPTYS